MFQGDRFRIAEFIPIYGGKEGTVTNREYVGEKLYLRLDVEFSELEIRSSLFLFDPRVLRQIFIN